MKTIKLALRLTVALAILMAATATVRAKDLQWESGNITDVTEERNLRLIREDSDKGITYTIQTDAHVYVATETSLSHHRLKDKRAEINDTVKFAIKGETALVLIGKDGKQYRMVLRKSTSR